MTARRFLISGRVQGVGFRWFVKEAPARAGVTGWVRNLDDGRVETLIEGESDAVTRVEHDLRIGPRHARVDRVGVHTEQPSGTFATFSII